MAEIALRVAGRRYRGWTSGRVTRGIDTLAGSFELSVTERWAGQAKPWPIGENDPCAVLVEGVPLITGFVDYREPSFNAAEHTVTLGGRDASQDLVDSSAILGRWEFNNTPVKAIVEAICKPYGVPVSVQPGLNLGAISIPKKHSIDPGDSALQAIENVCKTAGLLVVSDGVGGVTITRAGTDRCATDLVEGKNILAGRARFNYADRYRDYEVLGNHKGREDLTGRAASAVKGRATDASARPGRTLVIRPEGNMTIAMAKARAEWEATVRAGRSEDVSVVVQGWTQADGSPWPVNKLVRIESPQLGVDGVMLIAKTTFQFDERSGTTTALDLRNPNAYRPDPNLGKSQGNFYWKEIVRGV